MSLLTDDLAPELDGPAPVDLPVPGGLPALPRVNLLPPEIADRARLRRLQLGLGAGVVAVAGAVGVLYLGAAGSVADAELQVQAADSAAASLRASSADFTGVLDLYAQADRARALLQSAMGDEVRFSGLLDDLSRTVPANVWLRTVEFSQLSSTGAGGDPVAAGPGIGTVTFSGVAFRHDDVAVWLEALGEQEGYAEATFTDSTAEKIDGRDVVTFTSTVRLTPDALSQRWTNEAGS